MGGCSPESICLFSPDFVAHRLTKVSQTMHKFVHQSPIIHACNKGTVFIVSLKKTVNSLRSDDLHIYTLSTPHHHVVTSSGDTTCQHQQK